jgi:cell division septal protein FtsQ
VIKVLAVFLCLALLLLPKDATYDLVHHKTILFEGDSLTGTEKAISRLPFEKSIFYWFLNPTEIEESLEQDPSIQKARVSKCGIRCFEISIKKREPKGLVVANDGGIWLVGDDGGFIRRGNKSDLKLPLIGGVFLDNPTPDLARRRVQNILRTIESLSKISTIKRIELLPRGELDVFIGDVPIRIKDGSTKEFEWGVRVVNFYKGKSLKRVDATYSKFVVAEES